MVDLGEFDPATRATTSAPSSALPETLACRLGRAARPQEARRGRPACRRAWSAARGRPVDRHRRPRRLHARVRGRAPAARRTARARGPRQFLGDRPDVPRGAGRPRRIVWLARGEGMPHVIAEAGAASLPVVATIDNGSAQQLRDEISGLHVPHEAPGEVAAAVRRLVDDKGLRQRLGGALQGEGRAGVQRGGGDPALGGALRRGAL